MPVRTLVRFLFIAVALSLTATRAYPATQFSHPFRWEFSAQGGALLPAGSQGRVLDSGVHIGGSFDYELTQAVLLGGDVFYSSSSDGLRTQFTGAGFHCRLRPGADFTNLYVQGGIDLYRVSYDPESSTRSNPGDSTRPGGNVAAGFDVATLRGVTLGVAGTYQGVIFARHNAVSYLTLGLYVSVRPGER